MKKLVLLVLVSLGLVVEGCKKNIEEQGIRITKSDLSGQNEISSDTENDNSENKSPEENQALQKISSKEIKQHVGDSLTVKGYVADVYVSDKVAYLNFENKFPKNAFSCAIFPGKFEEFGDLSKFKGKNVEVTGKVSTFKSKPQIILNSKYQIKILE